MTGPSGTLSDIERAGVGLSFGQTLVGLAARPLPTLRRVAAGAPIYPLFLVFIAWLLVSGLIGSKMNPEAHLAVMKWFPATGMAAVVNTAVFSLLIGLFFIFLITFIIHMVAHLFGGHQPYRSFLAAYLVIAIPFGVLQLAATPVPVLNFLVIVVGLVYTVLAIAATYDFTWPKAFGVGLISFIVITVGIVALAIGASQMLSTPIAGRLAR